MPVSLTEVAFFAPFTMGMSVFTASSISSTIVAYTEHVKMLHDDARAIKNEIASSTVDEGSLVAEINVDKQSGEKYSTDVLDDLRTINLDRDLHEKPIVCRLFQPASLSAHRAKNVNRTIWAAGLVGISMVAEILNFSSFSIPMSSFLSEGTVLAITGDNFPVNVHILVLAVLTYVLFRTSHSLKLATKYTSQLNKDLISGYECIRKVKSHFDFRLAASKALNDDSD